MRFSASSHPRGTPCKSARPFGIDFARCRPKTPQSYKAQRGTKAYITSSYDQSPYQHCGFQRV